MNEFIDVFPAELVGLSPNREVKFTIKVQPGTALIVKTPSRIATKELQELKNQLA